MVYLDLSVKDIEESARFYVDQLGLFDRLTDRRLKCRYDIDLIIDLVLCATHQHHECFDQSGHSTSSFRVHLSDEGPQLEILSKLKSQSVEFLERTDLGGHCLNFTDPSGNRLVVHANHGVIT